MSEDPSPGAAQEARKGEVEGDVDYPMQSEEDLRKMLDQAREQGRKLSESKGKKQESPEEAREREEARNREAARKEKVLARLAAKVDITFADLFDLGLGKPAAGCKLRCEVLRKVMEHWPNSKQVRVLDGAGDARSVFFYTDDNPYYNLDDVKEGMIFTFTDPYLHYFMDGQTGMRVENAKLVRLDPNPNWVPTRRLDYAIAEKEEGTKWVKQKKWDEACTRYGHAIEHITGCPTSEPELAAQRAQVEKSLYLNLALAMLSKENYAETIKLCRKALDIDPNLPKAYFRMGQAQTKDRQFEAAEQSFNKALEMEPNDRLIKDALRSLQAIMRERHQAESQLWKGKIQKEPTKSASNDDDGDDQPSSPPGVATTRTSAKPKPSGLAVSAKSAVGKLLNPMALSAAAVALLAALVAVLYTGK